MIARADFGAIGSTPMNSDSDINLGDSSGELMFR